MLRLKRIYAGGARGFRKEMKTFSVKTEEERMSVASTKQGASFKTDAAWPAAG
jgi:hypothetical protein